MLLLGPLPARWRCSKCRQWYISWPSATRRFCAGICENFGKSRTKHMFELSRTTPSPTLGGASDVVDQALVSA